MRKDYAGLLSERQLLPKGWIDSHTNVCFMQGVSGPSSGSSPTKKDPNAPPKTPLEKLLTNAGPLRGDGSDKFFGMENVSMESAGCLGHTS